MNRSVRIRVMIALLILCLAIVSQPAISTTDVDNIAGNLCNRDIPEDRTVEISGECRSSSNCKRSEEAAECVMKRENYCLCEVPVTIGERKEPVTEVMEERKKKEKCDSSKGYYCVKRSRCKTKDRRAKASCPKGGDVCCSGGSVKDCNKVKGHKCVSWNKCPSLAKDKYKRCASRSEVCCSVCEEHESYSCVKKSKCNKKYRRRKKKCPKGGDVCCSECKNLKDHRCTKKNSCPASSRKEYYKCKSSADVCCGGEAEDEDC